MGQSFHLVIIDIKRCAVGAGSVSYHSLEVSLYQGVKSVQTKCFKIYKGSWSKVAQAVLFRMVSSVLLCVIALKTLYYSDCNHVIPVRGDLYSMYDWMGDQKFLSPLNLTLQKRYLLAFPRKQKTIIDRTIWIYLKHFTLRCSKTKCSGKRDQTKLLGNIGRNKRGYFSKKWWIRICF